MITAKEFLSDFTRDLVEFVGERPTFIAGYARLMEIREDAIRCEENERMLALARSNCAVFSFNIEQRILELGDGKQK